MYKHIRTTFAAGLLAVATAGSAFAQGGTELTDQVMKNLNEAGVEAPGMTVSVDDAGLATIGGHFMDEMQETKAEKVIRETEGVTEIASSATIQ